MEKNVIELSVDEKIAVKELEDKIESMKSDKEKKCELAKEQLISMLEVTVDKYRTATGTAEALRTLRFAKGDGTFTSLQEANKLAFKLASTTNDMLNKAKKLKYEEMDQLCDGFYEKEFNGDTFTKLAYELMCIDLCRNVGGAAEDMVEFIKRVDEEIDTTKNKLAEYKNKEA